MNLSESKDFQVSSASLKEVRTFCRDVFEKINLPGRQGEIAEKIIKEIRDRFCF